MEATAVVAVVDVVVNCALWDEELSLERQWRSRKRMD
jgi:hypothetical protein